MKKTTTLRFKLALSAIALMSTMTTFSTNIINNGGFENAGLYTIMANWSISYGFGGVSVTVDNTTASTGSKSAKIVVSTTPTEPYSSALTSFLNFETGATYKVRFKAKATSASSLSVYLNKLYIAGNLLEKTASLTTEFQQFEFISTTPVSFSDHLGCLMFGYTSVIAGTTIWIDDVEVTVNNGITYYNCIGNGEFNEALNSRDWGSYFSSNDASATIDNSSKLSGANSLKITRNNIVGQWWEFQYYTYLSLQEGTSYKISFDAVGSTNNMHLGVFLDYSTMAYIGYNSSSTIQTTKANYSHYTNPWPYEDVFANPTILRFIELPVGSIWIDNLRIVAYKIELSTTVFNSNSPTGTIVGELLPLTDETDITYTLSLPDMSSDPTYSNSLFTTEGIKLKSNAILTNGDKKIRVGITDSNGSYITRDLTITVQGITTDVNVINELKQIKIISENNMLTVKDAENSNVVICDVLGKIIYSGYLKENTECITLPQTNPGVYILSFVKGDKKEIRKVFL